MLIKHDLGKKKKEEDNFHVIKERNFFLLHS